MLETKLLKSQIESVIPLLEEKFRVTQSKFFALLLKRYQTDLKLLDTLFKDRDLRYGRFCIRGGYDSYRISGLARDEALERAILDAEATLHQLLTAS